VQIGRTMDEWMRSVNRRRTVGLVVNAAAIANQSERTERTPEIQRDSKPIQCTQKNSNIIDWETYILQSFVFVRWRHHLRRKFAISDTFLDSIDWAVLEAPTDEALIQQSSAIVCDQAVVCWQWKTITGIYEHTKLAIVLWILTGLLRPQ